MAKQRGHGEGSIYRRKDGRWVASISLEHRKRKYFYGETRKEVQEKLRVALQELKLGLLATGPQQTVKQYLEQWLEQVHKPTIREGSYVTYHSVLTRHVYPGIGYIPLQKLTPQQLQSFYASVTDKGLSTKTVHVIHAVLHKAFDHAIKWGLIARNVCDSVSLPRKIRHQMQPLTTEQCQKLLQVAQGHKFEGLLTLAVATGMRRGELLALRWQDVDLEQRTLHVRRTVDQLPHRGYVENEPKTIKGIRQIVLPEFAITALQKQREHQYELQQKAGDKWLDHDLVFSAEYGGYISPKYLWTRFKALLREAKLPTIRFHDLRHSAATLLLTMGVHPKVVQELLGHSQISMTLDIYSHVLPSMQRDAMSKMDSIFKQQF